MISDEFEGKRRAICFIRKFLIFLTVAVGFLMSSRGVFAQNTYHAVQCDTISSMVKSRKDDVREIKAKIEEMTDEEVAENLKIEAKKFEENKKRFPIFQFLSEQSKKTKDRSVLQKYMRLNSFLEKHPEYFDSKTLEDFLEVKYIEQFSESELQEKINEEKERFRKLGILDGNEYFKLEDDIEKSVNPKAFLLSIQKVNNIFERYNDFLRSILGFLKKSDSLFKIHSFTERPKISFAEYSESDVVMYVCSMYFTSKKDNLRLFNLFISKSIDYASDFSFGQRLIEVYSGFRSYVGSSELISSVVTHEIGHVFEYRILFELAHGNNEKWSAVGPELFGLFLKSYLPDMIKERIIRIAKEKYGGVDSVVSGYAEANSKEWFAEVFANLECAGKEENISPFGKAMKDVLEAFAREDYSIFGDVVPSNEEQFKKLISDLEAYKNEIKK